MENISSITGETAVERKKRHERVKKQLAANKKKHPEQYTKNTKFTTQMGDFFVSCYKK